MAIDLDGLANAIYRQAATELASATESELAEMVGRLVALTEERLQAERSADEETELACGAGCGDCCILNVTVLFPEAVAIAGHLKEKWPQAAVERFMVQASPGTPLAFNDEGGDILRQSHCLFLTETQECSIYPVRPLLCRAVTSTDADMCRRALAAEAGGGEPVPVVMDLLQKAGMENAFCALAQAIDDVRLDSRGVLLVPAAAAILREPKMAAEWLSGKALAF